MSGVTFDRVTKRFGDVTAVDSLSLEIPDKEFMVLLGPSGCGKTTALRMVAGLETVTEGALKIGDRVVNNVEPKERDISMVFQSYALYPHMNVAKNIEFPLKTRPVSVDGQAPRKLNATERREKVQEAARILGLDEYLDRKPAALSGGQRQRVALARAIVRQPQAFLMDEPLSNLDAKLRAATRVELVDLHRRVETTFVYVTHDQVEAMTMATHIAIMSDGRLQQVGTPQDVYQRPVNLFVARFIGSPPMNTVDGVIASEAGESVVRVGTSTFPAGAATGQRLEDGRRVVLGIRPEHLSLGDGPVKADVHTVEWLGHERHLICDIGGSMVTVREPADGATVKAGEAVSLTADPAFIHLFDADTTERLN
jgi:multiple sugar transport system ATP-binding protein